MLFINLKLTKNRIIATVSLTVAIVTLLVCAFSNGTVKLSDDGDRRALISKLGYTLEYGKPLKKNTAVPENTDDIQKDYLEVLQKGGFDIAKYRKEKITVYTYPLENVSTGEINLIITEKGELVGGDVTTAEKCLPLVTYKENEKELSENASKTR